MLKKIAVFLAGVASGFTACLVVAAMMPNESAEGRADWL